VPQGRLKEVVGGFLKLPNHAVFRACLDPGDPGYRHYDRHGYRGMLGPPRPRAYGNISTAGHAAYRILPIPTRNHTVPATTRASSIDDTNGATNTDHSAAESVRIPQPPQPQPSQQQQQQQWGDQQRGVAREEGDVFGGAEVDSTGLNGSDRDENRGDSSDHHPADPTVNGADRAADGAAGDERGNPNGGGVGGANYNTIRTHSGPRESKRASSKDVTLRAVLAHLKRRGVGRPNTKLVVALDQIPPRHNASDRRGSATGAGIKMVASHPLRYLESTAPYVTLQNVVCLLSWSSISASYLVSLVHPWQLARAPMCPCTHVP
jgi:hypothetical protein